MIWICTICLLLIAAWLFFNALNERRWVHAHSHDETVASDQGFLPSFSALTGTGALSADGKVSIDEENSGFARAVKKVKQTTDKYGEKFIESKANAARIDDPEQRPGSASEENTLFGRAVARVGAGAGRMEQKLEARVNRYKSGGADSGENESAFARASRKVVSSSEAIGQKVATRARNLAQGQGDGYSATDENGMFSKVVGTVKSGVGKIESKIDAKANNARNADAEREDLLTRVSAKVGNKMNELDDKVVAASKRSVEKSDE